MSYNTSLSAEGMYMNGDKMVTTWIRNNQEPVKSGGHDTCSRYYRVCVVCLLLMCVLLLATVMLLGIQFNNVTRERDQLQKEREELQEMAKLGWTYFSSSFYYISTVKNTWTGSREDCRRRGADLVIITSEEEQKFIAKFLKSTKAWIGLSDRNSENIWKWVDDTPLTNGYWESGEPNGFRNEDCVIAGDGPDPDHNWADNNCKCANIWICEKRMIN